MSNFTEKDLQYLIDQSFFVKDDDFLLEYIHAGYEHLQTYVVPSEEGERDPSGVYESGKISEIIFNADIKDIVTSEPILKSEHIEPEKIVINRGPERAVEVTTQEPDRYVGFMGVALARKITEVYSDLKKKKVDFLTMGVQHIKSYFQGEENLDVFEPPYLYSGYESNMVATYKKVYYTFLDRFINERRVIYINGMFQSASIRNTNKNVDCLYFTLEDLQAAQQKRKIRKTPGTDFYAYDMDDWLSFIFSYEVIEHSLIFGDIYEQMRTYQVDNNKQNVTMIGIAVTPYEGDPETYIPQNIRLRDLDSAFIDEQKAKMHGLQIFFHDKENDFVCVYMDHGRYIDQIPQNYDTAIKFSDLSDWKRERFFNAFYHFSVIMNGIESSLYPERYPIFGGEESFIPVKDGVYVVDGIPYVLRGKLNSQLYLRDGKIIDFKDPRPYWIRRLLLRNAGVVFDNVEEPVDFFLPQSQFLEFYSYDELKMINIVQEKKIKPYFRVDNIGYNPILRNLVYAPRVTSYLLLSNQKIGIGVNFDESSPGIFEVDDQSELRFIPTICYNETHYGSIFQSIQLDKGKLDEALEALDELG